MVYSYEYGLKNSAKYWAVIRVFGYRVSAIFIASMAYEGGLRVLDASLLKQITVMLREFNRVYTPIRTRQVGEWSCVVAAVRHNMEAGVYA